MSQIRFEATPFKIGTWTVLLLSQSASAQLPSRGQVMVKGTINGYEFQAALEPDGRGSHWFKVDDTLCKVANLSAGDTAELAIESTKEWAEPDVPKDIAEGIAANKKAYDTWTGITPMARREWIRWIRATNNPATREKHIEVACSKMEKGMRRPCCFNASMCTEPAVSRNGVLLEPTKIAA